MELDNLTIKDAIEALKNKLYSITELTKSCLDRIQKTDNKLKAFLTVDKKGALEQAFEADKFIRLENNPFEKKPLLGIPIALKDIYSTCNLRTTAGSKVLENYIPPYDATTVKKLKEAGVIILGKTNLDAWAHGASGENTDFDPTRNPYDLSRVPGGSSSGSGAAVSVSACLMAGATDTGGSIRMPSAYCNVVGIKPTYGRVSRYGIIAMASSFDTIGHITKTVYDNAKVLEVTAGKDQYDATTPDIPAPKYSHLLSKKTASLTIGVPKEYFIEGIDKRVGNITQEAVKILESLGFNIKTVSLPHTKEAIACYYILVPAEISSNLARYDGIRFGNDRKSFGAEAKRRIMLGAYTLSSGYYDAYYLKAAKVRALIRRDFEEAFKKVDLILAPVSPHLPFKIGEKVNDPLQMYLEDVFTCPVNIAGVPSLSIPAGFIDGLPVGIQLIGPQFKEEILYQVGYQFEQETQYYKIRPKIDLT